MVLLALVVFPTRGQAQEPARNDRVARALPSSFPEPGCDLKEGHYLVGSAATYLDEASQTSVRDNKERMYADAIRVLEEAILDKGQADNGAAWYYLGRAHMRRGDLAGLDTAFARASELLPECQADITEYRRSAWVALVRPAGEFLQTGEQDSAVVLLREADEVYQAEPQAPYLLGIVFANNQQPDSAAYYFQRAVDIASQNEVLSEDRDKAMFNLAIVQGNMGQWATAAATWEQYLEWVPDDLEAKKALAQAYRNAGEDAKAQEIEAALLAAATTGAGAMDGMSVADLSTFGVNAFNDGNYEGAAEAFGAMLTAEPHNRDAMLNRTNALYALVVATRQVAAAHHEANEADQAAAAEAELERQALMLIESAEYLLLHDPLNSDAQKMLGEGYRITGNQEKLLEVFTAITAAPLMLDVESFDRADDQATLTVQLTGRQPQDIQGDNVPAKPVTVLVEFLNDAGEPVATEEVTFPVLAPDATDQVVITGVGSGITWWRYSQTS